MQQMTQSQNLPSSFDYSPPANVQNQQKQKLINQNQQNNGYILDELDTNSNQFIDELGEIQQKDSNKPHQNSIKQTNDSQIMLFQEGNEKNQNKQKIFDDQQHLQELDISKSDYTETQSQQDTLRNFPRISEMNILNHSDFIELRSKQTSSDKILQNQSSNIQAASNQKRNQKNYYNLPDEEDSQSSSRIQMDDHFDDIGSNQQYQGATSFNKIGSAQGQIKAKRLAEIMSDTNPHLNVFTQDEEEKTHDLIKSVFLEVTSKYFNFLYQDGDDKLNYQSNQSNQLNNKHNYIDSSMYSPPQNGFEGIQKKNQKNKITTVSMKQQLPSIKINVPLSVTVNEIFEIFSNISKNQRYQIIEMEQNLATAINKEPFSLKRMFLRCIPFSDGSKDVQNDQFISAVRIQISVNEAKCCRKIHIKGLYGDILKLKEFTNSFKNKMQSLVENQNANDSRMASNRSHLTTKNNSLSSTNLNYQYLKNQRRPSKKQGQQIQNDDSDQEEQSQAYNETSAVYQIHKILSSEQYTLGKNIAQYIECFHMQYRSIKESAMLLPSPLYDKLFAMYACKNERDDRLFIERSNLIRRMKPHEIMIYLGIKEKFLLGDNIPTATNRLSNLNYDQSKYPTIQTTQMMMSPFRIDTSNNLKEAEVAIFDSNRSELQLNPHQNLLFMYNNGSTTSSLNLTQYTKQEIPYIEAIRSLEKMQQFQTPREKLQCLSESFQALKTTIVDHYKGKFELSAMDDVLPLTIYTVAMADLTHIRSEFNLMEDFLSIYDRGFEHEKRLLSNLDGSISYINHEWEI